MFDRVVNLLLGDQRRARRFYRLASRRVLRNPHIRHFEPSIIYFKEGSRASPRLMELMVESIKPRQNSG